MTYLILVVGLCITVCCLYLYINNPNRERRRSLCQMADRARRHDMGIHRRRRAWYGKGTADHRNACKGIGYFRGL